MRRLAVLLASAVFITALISPASSAAADPADGDRHAPSPVGVWSGTITMPSGEVPGTLSFHSDGTVCGVYPPPGPDGGVEGSGRWYRTGADTFAFLGLERFFDGAGATTGYLRISHDATFAGADTFSTTGTATSYDAQGNRDGSFSAAADMRRDASRPVPC